MAGSASNKVASKKGTSTRPRLVPSRYPAAGAARRARRALVLARSVRGGVAFNRRFTGDGAIIFKHACALHFGHRHVFRTHHADGVDTCFEPECQLASGGNATTPAET